MSNPGGVDILQRILSSAHRVSLVTGPAASGKTAAATAFYRHYESLAGRRCLMVAPNQPAVEHFKKTLLAGAPGGVVASPAVCTFAALAGRILATGSSPKKPLPALERHLLLKSTIAALGAAGELTAFAAVADTPGLAAALDRSIAELKRAALEPAVLEEALAAQGRVAGKAHDLLAVYRAYQQHLVDHDLYDLEGLLWEAREALAATPAAGPLAGVEAIVVDGFTDFTPTQLDILEHLSRRCTHTVVTLPVADDGRDRMWRWTRRTLAAIRGRFKADLDEIALPPPALSLPASLVGGLFDPDAATAPLPEGLAIIAASGIDAEVTAVAARIKRLLLDGEPPGSIAVLARTMETYRPCIERVFARCDVPIAPTAAALGMVPIIRFLLDVADLSPLYEFQPVLAVIKSSYFRPEALGDFTARTAATAEMVIRAGNVVEGAAAYSQAAARFARRAQPTDDGDEGAVDLGPLAANADEILAAGRMLDALFKLADSASASSHAEGAAAMHPLRTLADALGLAATAALLADDELLARDLRALQTLDAALSPLRPPWPDVAALRGALAMVPCPPGRGESLVDVLDVLDARSLTYRHVFLLGASEGEFPRRFSEGSLLGEADRQAYARHNIQLDSRHDLTSREMLLFYLAASRGEVSFTVSYLQSDASGSPGAPSPFLLSLAERFGGLDAVERTPQATRIEPGQFVPPAAQIASAGAALDAAMAWLFDTPGGSGDALAWVARQRPHLADRIAQGLFARHCRWQAGACDAYDGHITDPALAPALAERFGPAAIYSASQLNTYGQCPWHYFASYVLRLTPLAQPQRQLEPVTRGSFCHDVLFTLARNLAQSHGTPLKLAEVAEAELAAALDAAVAEESRRMQRPPYPVLWQLQQARMRQELWQYLSGQRAAPLGGAMYFELGFGVAERVGLDMQDPASAAEPVAVVTPAGEILLRGKIDRIDAVSAAGLAGLLVIDYKTGALPSLGDIVRGCNVQVPLYSLAAAKLLGDACLGGAFHRIGQAAKREQIFAEFKNSRGNWVANDAYQRDLDLALEAVGASINGLRGGRFDVNPAGGECPSYCPFRLVCHTSPARQLVKNPPQEGQP